MKSKLRYKEIALSLLLGGSMLLGGCGGGSVQSVQPQTTAAPAEEAAMPQEEPQITQNQSAELVPAEPEETKDRLLIHIERTRKDALDPAEGRTRILEYAWDNVRLESTRYPTAAAAIMETMAARQDAWYTGTGETASDTYGYNAMLEAAEDGFTIAREYGNLPEACCGERFVTVLRADDTVCAFLVSTATDLGIGPKKTVYELLCFNPKTGELLFSERAAEDAGPLYTALNSRWTETAAEGTAAVTIRTMDELIGENVEIVDQVVIGDGGEACLLVFSGTALDVQICSVSFADSFAVDQQLFYCGELSDCALQMALLFPGDLPSTMLRWRDSEGEHEYLVMLSGEDGHIFLSEHL